MASLYGNKPCVFNRVCSIVSPANADLNVRQRFPFSFSIPRLESAEIYAAIVSLARQVACCPSVGGPPGGERAFVTTRCYRGLEVFQIYTTVCSVCLFLHSESE